MGDQIFLFSNSEHWSRSFAKSSSSPIHIHQPIVHNSSLGSRSVLECHGNGFASMASDRHIAFTCLWTATYWSTRIVTILRCPSSWSCTFQPLPCKCLCPHLLKLFSAKSFKIFSLLQNDSGSPMVVVEADNNPTLVGISSFISGVGCNSNRSTVYLRISFYLRWIQQTTGIQVANDFVF